MQFIDYENIKVNSQTVDNVALSVLTGLGYFIINRLTGKNKMKDAKNNLIENYKKLEDSKQMNLYKNHLTEDQRKQEPTTETYKRIFINLKQSKKDENQRNDIEKEVLSLFAEMKLRELKPDYETFSAVLSVMLEGNKNDEALSIYEEIDLDLTEASADLMVNLLKVYKVLLYKRRDYPQKSERLEKMDRIFTDFSDKFHSQIPIGEFNELLEAFLNSNKHLQLQKIFNKAIGEKRELNADSFLLLIKSFAQENKFDESHAVLKLMEDLSIPANEIIYGCLMNCAVKCNKFLQIKTIWEEMQKKQIKPNSIIYSILIKAYNRMKLFDAAFDIYEQISKEGKIDSIVIYNAMLDICVESKNLEKLKEIFEYVKVMGKMSQEFPKPNLITYSTVIKGFAKCEKMTEAMELYENLKAEKFELDEVLFNTLIDGYARIGDEKNAIKIYEEARAYGVKGSAIIYSILIKMYSKLNDIKNALKYFTLYKEEKHKATIVPYSTLIQLYIRRKELDKAIELFEEIKKRGMKPDVVSFNFIINGCSFNRKLEKAIEYMHESFRNQIKLSDDTYNNTLEYLITNKFMKVNERIRNISEILKVLKERKYEIPYELYSRLMKIVYSANENKVQKPNNKFDMKTRA